MPTGIDWVPADVPLAMVVWSVKMLSPATASGGTPSSSRETELEPPIDVRSAVTAIPVLSGFWPGVTVTLRTMVSPGQPAEGLAVPAPLSVAPPQGFKADAVFRGLGVPAVKSVLLL